MRGDGRAAEYILFMRRGAAGRGLSLALKDLRASRGACFSHARGQRKAPVRGLFADRASVRLFQFGTKLRCGMTKSCAASMSVRNW